MRRAALALEIAAAYLQARRLLRRRDLPATLAALRPRTAPATSPPPGAAQRAAGLGGAVVRTLTALPADSRCLMRSLVLSRLLDRRGIPSALVIGVQPGEAFGAHAWVEVGGQPVLDPGGATYPRLVEL